MQQNHTLGRCAAMHAVHLPCHPQPRRIFNTVSAPRRLVSLHRRVLPPILSMDAPTPTVEPAIEQPTTMATASRGLQAPSTTVTKDVSTQKRVAPEFETDSNGVQRLKYVKGGWSTWQWEGYNVNYVQYGDSGPPLVLVHGFGASAYHYRYNIPALAATHRVYALDLLGFGFSDKPVIDYNTPQRNVWADEIVAFVQQVVLPECEGQKPVLVGNSLGGYNVLAAAAQTVCIRGIAVVNGAGRFDDTTTTSSSSDTTSTQKTNPTKPLELTADHPESIIRQWLTTAVDTVTSTIKRVVLHVTFIQTKQPARIMSVLQSVYLSPQNVDQALVESIVDPAQHPDAPDVFAKVITGNGRSVNELLRALPDGTPVLLLWGMQDPWIGPSKARQIQTLYPAAQLVPLDAGHCPHDDTPQPFNESLTKWIASLP